MKTELGILRRQRRKTTSVLGYGGPFCEIICRGKKIDVKRSDEILEQPFLLKQAKKWSIVEKEKRKCGIWAKKALE